MLRPEDLTISTRSDGNPLGGYFLRWRHNPTGIEVERHVANARGAHLAAEQWCKAEMQRRLRNRGLKLIIEYVILAAGITALLLLWMSKPGGNP